MKSFCTALDRLPGHLAVLAEWEQLTGDSFQLVRSFLDPRETPARSVPCRNTPSCRCRHEVIESSSGAMEAVCRCEFGNCPPIPVTEKDLIIYGLSLRRFGETLAAAMKLDSDCHPIHGMPWAFHIASYRPNATVKFPVYLIAAGRQSLFEKAVMTILLESGEPAVFLSPNEMNLSGECRIAIERARAQFIPLIDVLSSHESRVRLTDLFFKQLQKFDDRAGVSEDKPVGQFPTPPGSTWTDISIRFIYTDKAEITVGGSTKLVACHELGMADKRTKEPTAPWKFLYEIALNHRVIDFTMGNPQKNKDWKNRLSRELRRVFGLKGDPFLYDKRTKTWEAKFQAEA